MTGRELSFQDLGITDRSFTLGPKVDERLPLGASDWRCQQSTYMGNGKFLFHNGEGYEVLDFRTQEQKDFDEAMEEVDRIAPGIKV